MSRRTIPIKAPPLHPGQQRVRKLLSRNRFVVVLWGRRGGKTKGGASVLLEGACDRALPYWWVAPTFDVARYGWREIVRLARQIPGCRVWSPDRPTVDSVVALPNGSEIRVRSADKPDTLRGEGLGGCVVDECSSIDRAAWEEGLYPALADREGWALLIGTPKGPNWLYERYLKGQDDNNLYASDQMPSTVNPYLPADFVANAKENMPERIFRQEILAEVLDDAGVFQGVNDCAVEASEFGQPVDDREARIVFGLDWGKLNDSTVCIGWDIDRSVAKLLYRDTGTDYGIQRKRIAELSARFHPVVIAAELNSIGEPNVEELQKLDLPVEGITTGVSDNRKTQTIDKSRAIDDLALCFEQRRVQLERNEVMMGELRAFTMLPGRRGRAKYGAPQGYHDDCVMALMMAREATELAGRWQTVRWA